MAGADQEQSEEPNPAATISAGASELEEDGPLLPPADGTASRVSPGAYRRRGPGCLWQLVFFVVMLVLGVVAAATLRGRSDANSGTTLAQGSAPAEKGTVTWKVKASVDDQRARCINLYVGDDQDPLTGGCLSPGLAATGADVHEAQLSGSKVWVIFGLAPKGTDRVRLPLTNAATKVVPADSRDGVADRYYVWTAPAAVHTAGDATLEAS